MYGEQWSPSGEGAPSGPNGSNGNTFLRPNRNSAEVHHYLMARHPEVYPGGVHYTNSPGDVTDIPTNGNSFGAPVYDRGASNFNMNFAAVDLNSGQPTSADLYKEQYNMLNINNKYEVFPGDMDQYTQQQQQHLAMMYNSMKNMPPLQHNTVLAPERTMPPPPAPVHPHHVSPTATINGDSTPINQKSQLIDNFLGNWTSSPSGTYTPFGHSFLNVQPNILLQKEHSTPKTRCGNTARTETPAPVPTEPEIIKQNEPFMRKDSDGISFSDVGGKKRIVAEVKPMRPSYSAVLSKTPKTNNAPESNKKKDLNQKENVKPNVKVAVNKQEKFRSQFIISEKSLPADEKAKKTDADKKNSLNSQVSSGSESGENIYDSSGKNSNRNKSKTDNNTGRKYISLDDLMNDDDNGLLEEKPGYNNCDSEFVFVTQPEDRTSSRKRNNKKTSASEHENATKQDDEDSATSGRGEDIYPDSNTESDRFRRKHRESKSNSNARKLLAEKNKKNSQGRNKKPKSGGHLGKLQNFLDHWLIVMKNVFLWFFNLLSDIFRMSAQLSVDFASISFRNTYNWASDFCTSVREKATSPQWLKDLVGYIDKKIGHTWVGFWRNMKFLKFLRYDDDKNAHKQNNSNIPLPATGDEAMKRLLACKGKDPYSILGVGAQCSDEDIKRYYRRQAFLVHPDKNQQPGAEEAFKILQHAFDLIGVPARREAYDRKLVESAQMEAALSEVAELLAQLQDKVKHAAGTIRCTNCCRRHVRTITTRPAYAARYCQQCKIRHAAKEGDIWAESKFWGLVWKYYACMDGAVYQITQWASCQKKNLKHLVANTHHVQYRIVLGNNKTPPNNSSSTTGTKQNFNNSRDANLEDFLNNLYSKTGQTPGETRNGNTTSSSGDANKNRRKTKKCKV